MKARVEDGIIHSPFPAADIPCCSFYQAAKKALLDNASKPALADGCTLLTRGELFVRIQRYAAGFQQNGIQPGDRVCVHVGDTVDNFAAMLGCVFAGASIVLAKTSLTERELRYQISDSDCTHVLIDPEFAEKTIRAVSTLPLKGQFATGPAEGFTATNDFVKMDEAVFREVLIEDPRDCVLAICYTSGTTGLPKGVVVSHYGFVANIATAGPCFSWDESDVTLIAAPITHASGLLCITIGMLLGATMVMVSPKADVHRIAQLVSKYKVTAASTLGTRLQSLAAEMRCFGIRLDSIRRLASCGSVLSEVAYSSILSAFHGVECLVNGYALTESMGFVCSPSIKGAQGTDSGFPAPWAQIKVVDHHTRQHLGANQTGEICFRLPTMMKEYYKRPKETADLFDEEGWCKSGDAGYYDEDGRLHFVQRLKEMIKCMDNQVVPAELEDLLLKEHLEEISEVAVVGLPHPDYGEAPAAAAALRVQDIEQDSRSLANVAMALKATIAANLAVHKHLYGGVFFFDSLPKTETMKVNRPMVVQACAGKTAF